MTYSRTYTIDAGPTGDTVKAAIATKLDGDLTNAYTYLNAHDVATTNVHGLGTAYVVGTTTAQTLTNKTISSPTITGGTIENPTLTGTVDASGATISSPTITGGTATNLTLVTPTLGAASGTSLTLSGLSASLPVFTDGSKNLVSNTMTGTGKVVMDTSPTISAPTISGHPVIEGVTPTGATGTGKLVFDTSPTLVTPTIGAASGTSLTLSGLTASLPVFSDGSKKLISKSVADTLTALRVREWIDYTASSSIVGWGSFVYSYISYAKINHTVFVQFAIAGESNSTTTTFTLPYDNVASFFGNTMLTGSDNGTQLTTPGKVSISTDIVTCYKDCASTLFTGSGTKVVRGQFFYECDPSADPR